MICWKRTSSLVEAKASVRVSVKRVHLFPANAFVEHIVTMFRPRNTFVEKICWKKTYSFLKEKAGKNVCANDDLMFLLHYSEFHASSWRWAKFSVDYWKKRRKTFTWQKVWLKGTGRGWVTGCLVREKYRQRLVGEPSKWLCFEKERKEEEEEKERRRDGERQVAGRQSQSQGRVKKKKK